ncbi:MAG: anthranilate phosphoribosyltransferase [Micrococcales bacterium]|nr:MAG: anthranilate phosphoribosyltransferase [Micrococcales bacterium]PIE27477.1 MAG: anthranilate phosphoribosyltransferase [Micrococcales bacterium]
MRGQPLAAGHTRWALDQVMSGDTSPVQLAGFLVALRAKGETVEEVTGLVEAMLAHAVRIDVPGETLDIVGTGGDQQHTVNVSTMAALVAAGAGAVVVKHGNRAASSRSGTADVLEALGVRLDLPPAQVAALAGTVGMTLCFAQVFHPAMRHAMPARRELGVPTTFNILGPLTNPAQPTASAVGVADERSAPLVAGVLAARGRRALVFRGEDGLDELTTTGPSALWWVDGGNVTQVHLDPADVGLPRATLSDLRGGDPAHNAGIVNAVLGGATGLVRDIVLLNAAAGLLALDGLPAGRPVQETLPDALRIAMNRAATAIDSGAAAAVLQRWREESAAAAAG